jgi:acyl-CoA synthetase (AMP-forming)/AMP-acid ligase II
MTEGQAHPRRAVPEDCLAADPPWRNVGELVSDAAARFGDRDALRFEGTRLSFVELDEQTSRLAAVLAARGIVSGDRVAMMIPNSLSFPLCWLALLRLGAVAVPVNTRLKSADLAHLLNDAEVALTVTSAELLAGARAESPAPTLDVATLLEEADQAATGAGFPSHAPSTLANLQYTSGTTGLPKACMLSHDYWLRLGWLLAGYGEIGDQDVVLTSQPFSYMDPQWNLIMCLIAGAPLVVLPRFSASGFWPAVREHGVTLFYVLATMPLLLLKQPPDPADRDNRMRLVLCSGIVPGLHETLEQRWGAPWREVYGMTETGLDLAVRSWEEDSVGSGVIGRPIATKEVAIFDERGERVARGEAGELCVRGKPLMSGYWHREEATAETIRDGWLHTGDLATMDEEGGFRLVGRLKDMVRRSGENIACAEVEAVLSQHPAVASVAVVPVPDELWGEEPKACIQLAAGFEKDVETAQDVVAFARERLARFKVPRYVEFVDEFPRTPSERISKPRLLAEERHGPVYDALEDVLLAPQR